MSILALVLVAVVVVSGSCAILGTIRRLRTPPELRGDWWSEFEREFRAYARRQANSGRDRRRHRGELA